MGSEFKELYQNLAPTILHAAILNERDTVCIELIDKGASINVPDHQKWTPLHCACYKGNTHVLKALLKHGAFLGSEDLKNRKPIHIAIERGFVLGEECCSALLLK